MPPHRGRRRGPGRSLFDLEGAPLNSQCSGAAETVLGAFDVRGRRVLEDARSLPAGRSEMAADLEDEPAGIHLVRVRIGAAVHATPVTVVR